MSDKINLHRRQLFGVAATVGVAQLGLMEVANAQTAMPTPVNASGSATSFQQVKQINAGLLNVGYAEVGPANGAVVFLLHGWPYDIHTYVDVAPLLAATGYRVIVPHARGYGTTRFLSSDAPRNGQQAALALDLVALMDALKIDKAIMAGCDWGARTACIMAVLWPERTAAIVSVSGYLLVNLQSAQQPLPPTEELKWWYQYYLSTERGRKGYDANHRAFAKLIWQTASPQWKFSDAVFERSAKSLDNPDHTAIAVHNYRWRLGLAQGEARYDAMESKLSAAPRIVVPAITMEGDANGAPHPEPAAYAGKFGGRYEHRNIAGGIGHNLPQESPREFAQAVIDIGRA